MRTMFVLFTILSLMVLPAGIMNGEMVTDGGCSNPDTVAKAQTPQNIAQVAGSYFTMNQGQITDPGVLFHSQNAYFTTTGVFFRVLDDEKGHVFKAGFQGADPTVPEGRGRMSHDSNFFLGNDPSLWATDVPNFREIVYENLYDGIDLTYRSVPEGIKYEFQVRPGGDPSDIRIEHEGADITTDGNTVFIETPVGIVMDGGLIAYQEDGIQVRLTVQVECNIVSYSIPSYDSTKTLVIDPLIFSTFFGGTASDAGYSMAVDSSGNVYVTGDTTSADFPATPGAFDTTRHLSSDGLVLKLNATGTGLLYATYFGGNSIDHLYSLVVDTSNNVYVTGETYSTDLPTTASAPWPSFLGNVDCYVFKLNAAGNGLLYCTYLGGSSHDTAYDITIDSSNSTYVTGYAWSTDFPILGGAYCGTYNGMGDIFVSKFNPAGTDLLFSTWVGTSTWDYGDAIALDTSNNVYVLGRTNGTNFPTTAGAYDTSYNGDQYDAVVFKLNSWGSAMSYSTFLGGSNWEMLGDAGDIAVDGAGNAYVTGVTYSSNFPTTTGAYDTTYGSGGDVFITKLNDTGKGLVYSTFVGNTGTDVGYDITLDASNNSYVAGSTSGAGFPTTVGAYSATYGGGTSDTFVLSLNSTGKGLIYSTYLGGNAADISYDIALDTSNNTYVTGSTVSPNFPVSGGAYCATASGGGDGFVAKLSIPLPPTATTGPVAVAGDGYVQLGWTAPVDNGGLDITNYRIFRGQTPIGLSLFKTIGNVTTYNDTPVTNGMTYFYAIAAVNLVGEGAWSPIVNGTPCTIPGVPLSVTAVIGDHYVNLTWTAPTDDGGHNITGYKVLRGTAQGTLSLLTSLGNITAHNDTTVLNGVTYYYAVTAMNMNGDGSNSTPISAIPGRSPAVPANLTAQVGDGYVHVFWDPPADTGGYALTGYRTYKNAGTGAMALLIDLAVTDLNDTAVENGISYNYSVSALNLRGEGLRCPSVTARPGKVPEAPTVTATSGDGSIELSWTPGADGGYPITTFTIYRGTDASDLQDIANTSGTFYNDTTIENGVNYFYSVSATNAMGEGPRSTTVEAMFASIPGAPENLTATSAYLGGISSVDLSWDPPKDNGGLSITDYVISRATDGSLLILKEVKTTVYKDTAVVNGIKYRYVVSAKNEMGWGPNCREVEATPYGLPGKVVDLKATAGDGFVFLSWKAPVDDGGSAIEAYSILRSESLVDSVTSMTYNDTGVENGVLYKYQVAAKNIAGAGEVSDVSVITSGRPGTPGNLTVEAKGTAVVLKWTAPENKGGLVISEYTIYRGETAQSLALYDIGGRSTDFTYTDKDVVPGKTYYYAVTARNSWGEGPKSTVASAQVPTDGGGGGTEGGGQSQSLLIPILLAVIVAVVLVVVLLLWKKRAKGTGQVQMPPPQPTQQTPTPEPAQQQYGPPQQQYEQPQPPPPQPEMLQQEMAYQP